MEMFTVINMQIQDAADTNLSHSSEKLTSFNVKVIPNCTDFVV